MYPISFFFTLLFDVDLVARGISHRAERSRFGHVVVWMVYIAP